MRRKDREVKDLDKIMEVIAACDTIRLGFQDGMYPYIVPVSFGYEAVGEQIYFYIHGALEGRKADLIKKNGVCSFEMDCDHVLELLTASRGVTVRYKCLMGKADIEVLEGEDRKKGLDILMSGYKDTMNYAYNEEVIPHTMVARLKVTECSCKINPYRAG